MHAFPHPDHDPIEVLQLTPVRVEEIFEGLAPSDLEAGGEGGDLGARGVLALLADVELTHAFRLRLILADDEPVLQPFEADAWARRYARSQAALAVGAFRSLRSWNLSLLTTLDLDDWLRRGYHPERGFVTIDELVRSLAAHDLEQLTRLERLAGSI